MTLAFIHGPVPEELERELGASVAEFERDLNKAWPDGVSAVAPGHYRLHDGALQLDIHVEPVGVRRIGLLAIPRLAARYVFAGADEGARRSLLARLDRAMQRGGG